MSIFILLPAAAANAVRGPSLTVPSAALNPIEREGGLFILSVLVLSDPAHAEHYEFLNTFPLMDTNDPAFPPEIIPPEDAPAPV